MTNILLCAIRDALVGTTGGTDTTNTLLASLDANMKGMLDALNADNTQVMELQCYTDKDGKAIALSPLFDVASKKVVGYVDEFGTFMAGPFEPNKDPCACLDCPKCGDVVDPECVTCAYKDELDFADTWPIDMFKLEADGNGQGDWTAQFTIEDPINGTSTNVVSDYLSGNVKGNKSEWYVDVVAAVNAIPGITMTLIKDVAKDTDGKPRYSIVSETCNDVASAFGITYVKDITGGKDIYGLKVSEDCKDHSVSASDGGGEFGTPAWGSQQ